MEKDNSYFLGLLLNNNLTEKEVKTLTTWLIGHNSSMAKEDRGKKADLRFKILTIPREDRIFTTFEDNNTRLWGCKFHPYKKEHDTILTVPAIYKNPEEAKSYCIAEVELIYQIAWYSLRLKALDF